ncbi:MAG: S-layer homology domain-containing protein, partial [Anaerolineae bacterium]
DPSQSRLMNAIYRHGELAEPTEHLEGIYAKYAGRKPIMIAETGVSGAIVRTGENCASWAAEKLRRLYAYLPILYPRVKAVFYFDVDRNLVQAGQRMWANYGLTQDEEILRAYREAIKHPAYLEAPGKEADFEYRRLGSLKDVEFRTGVVLAAYAKLPEVAVKRVEYRLNGRPVARGTSPPFEVEVRIPEGSHVLEVSAYGEKFGARKSYSIEVRDGRITVEAGEYVAVPKRVRLRDTDTHWASALIRRLAEAGAVSGYPDATFRPEGRVTRAEFLKMLAKALGYGAGSAGNRFPDVPAGHWAKRLIEGAVESGIVPTSEYPGGFGADRPITRGEMAAWLVRALRFLGEGNAPRETGFSDDALTPKWQREYIAKAREWELVSGYPDGTFGPGKTATRAEAVAMLSRAILLRERNGW